MQYGAGVFVFVFGVTIILAGFQPTTIFRKTNNNIRSELRTELPHYGVKKSVSAGSFKKIDDKTFVVNHKKYQVQNQNDVTTSYSHQIPAKRSIKLVWQQYPKHSPKYVNFYYKAMHDRNLPTSYQHNSTLNVSIKE